MLEIRNLTKIYKTKGGVITKALDNVSVKFPDKGMVFLLGKSGSGKSTLLNVSGGLDKPDSGEIIIKGKNSKDFSGADFDSYRNTYIGFIFQEYNILDEFNIEQNISLALQLQGKPNDKDAVEKMLEQVDLKGFGKRKPNTLSGGQKQRIAIARALIKNPEIIMADEPTGALDSKTGEQVFDTLKKLSKDKLIIVVSHDRDFAEIYGDRIIELSDGKIIKDVSKEAIEAESVNKNIHIVNENTITISDAENLTKSDVEDIYKLLKGKKGEVVISSGEHDVPLVKQAIRVRDDNKSEVFKDTKEIKTIDYDPSKTKFIRSRLPMSRAIKMGSSSLKTKPFRLIITLLLTTVALTMFGVTSTLLFYDSNYSVKTALENSPNDYEAAIKRYRYKETHGKYNLEDGTLSNTGSSERGMPTEFGIDELKELNNNSVGHRFAGVFGVDSPESMSSGGPLTFSNVLPTAGYYSFNYFYGFTDCGESYMNENGFSLLAGKYPTDSNSIAISKYMFEVIKTSDINIRNYSDVVDRSYEFNISTSNVYRDRIKLNISGIYDVGNIPSVFDPYRENEKDNRELSTDYKNYMSRSYHLLAYVSDKFYEDYRFTTSERSDRINPLYASGGVITTSKDVSPTTDNNFGFYPSDVLSLENVFTYVNEDMEPISYKAPGDNEIYLPSNVLAIRYYNMYEDYFVTAYLIADNKKFSDNLKDVSDTEIIDKVNMARNEMYNGGMYNPKFVEDFEYIKNLVESNYSKIRTNEYIFKKSYFFKEQYMKDVPTYDEDLGFKAFLEKYKDMESDNSKMSQDNFDYLNQYLASHDVTDYIKHGQVCYAAQNLYYTPSYFDKDPSYWDDVQSSIQAIYNNYGYNPSLEADYEALYQKCLGLNYSGYSSAYNAFGSKFDYVSNYVAPGYTPKSPTDIHCYYKSANGSSGEFKIIGYYKTDYSYFTDYSITSIANAKKFATFNDNYYYFTNFETDYSKPIDAKYDLAITKTDYTQSQLANLRQDKTTYYYDLTNVAYQDVSSMISMVNQLKQIFLIIGVVVAVFASLMLLNFISSSISGKMKEIGILRAVGARGSDLFKIFFSESGIITIICFVIAIVSSIITSWRLNVMFYERVKFYVLNFNVLNILIIIVGSLLIAFFGTFFPVLRASKKAPVDSIRTL